MEDETKIGDRWDWTIGEMQYQWLKETLENSDAPFKFVFAHQTTAGIVDYGHGGVDGARYCEWGGHNYPEMDSNEDWTFHQHRPGWEIPIHQLMAENGVTIFFHGHDHVFAREELDGVIYLEMPHTAHSGYAMGFDLYSSTAGVINNSGHVRVTVSESDATFEYVRAFLPENETLGSCDLNDYINCRKNGEVYYSETILAPTPNDQPNAQDDEIEIQESSGPVSIAVLDNDADPNGDPITVVGVSQPDNGITEKVVPGDTTVQYTPNHDYCGASPDVFSYVISDGFGRTDSASVTVTVACVNDPPVTTDDNASTSPEETLVVQVLDNDSDPDGNIDPTSVTIASPPSNGSAAPTGTGTVAYTPNAGFIGLDTFEYEVCDTESLCALATVTVSVFEEPQPKLEFTSVVVGEEFVTVQLENVYMSPVVVCSAQYANNTIPVVVRVDNALFDSFDIWLQNPSNAPVVEETVNCLVVEEGVWIIDDVAIEAHKYNSTVTNTASTWIGEPQNYGQSYVQPVVIGQVMSANDDAWSVFYARGATRTDPPSDLALATGKMVGEDILTDRLDETVGFVVIEAGHHTIAGTELVAALGDDTVAGATDSPPYVYTLPSTLGEAPAGAVVSLAGMDGLNGGWAQLHGTSPFSTSSLALSIDEDQIGDSERAHTAEQVAYLVFCPTVKPNHLPTAQDQAVALEEDGSLSIVLSGFDPDEDPLTFTVLTRPQHGVLSGSGDTFTYTPEPDFNGDDSFSFTADDGFATSAAATVSIVVTPINDSPAAGDLFIDTTKDTPVDIVSPATDADGDILDYVAESPINGGQVIVDGETIRYTPASGYCGSDVFDYAVSDGSGASDTGLISVMISCSNNDPVAVADNATVQSGETVVIDVASNDYDLDGDLDPSTVQENPSTPVIGGTLSNMGNGTFDYAASADFSGTDYFDYTICDSAKQCATATVTIEVRAAPQVLNFVTVTADNTPQTVILDTPYNQPVVVCSAQYIGGVPAVVRVSDVSEQAFTVRMQNPSGNSVSPVRVDCLVVEEGAHVVEGVAFEAQSYNSTITDSDSSWVGESQSYLQSYDNPLVFGQVMTENNPSWSVFWCQGETRTDPPSQTTLITGKTVGEDSDTSRVDERIGFVVFEAGHVVLGDLEIEAALGADTVQGIDNAPPYTYDFNAPFAQNPIFAVVTMSGVNGINGGWAQTHGSNPLSATFLDLSIDEDQLQDSERNHIAERVAYLVAAPNISQPVGSQ